MAGLYNAEEEAAFQEKRALALENLEVGEITPGKIDQGLLTQENPAAIKQPWSINDPRMALLPESARAALSKQALYRGMGDMGMGLLAQSGFQAGPAPTLGEAIGKAAPAFSKGVGDTIAQGLLTDDTLTKRATEAGRVARVNEFLTNSYISESEKQKVRLAIDIGDTSSAMEHLFRAEETLINKIDVKDFTTKSVEKFKNSRNYADLMLLDDGSGRSGGSGGISAENSLYKQAFGLFGGDIDPNTEGLQILKADSHRAQALYAEASRRWKSGAPFESVIAETARDMKIPVVNMEDKKLHGIPDYSAVEKDMELPAGSVNSGKTVTVDFGELEGL